MKNLANIFSFLLIFVSNAALCIDFGWAGDMISDGGNLELEGKKYVKRNGLFYELKENHLPNERVISIELPEGGNISLLVTTPSTQKKNKKNHTFFKICGSVEW